MTSTAEAPDWPTVRRGDAPPARQPAPHRHGPAARVLGPPRPGSPARWRVSLARITGDGPFSTFRGVDRTFSVLDGAGVVLPVGAGPPTRLAANGGIVRFAGEAPCGCRFPANPATALNVTTARDAFDCAVARWDGLRGLPRVAGAITLLVCGDGEVDTSLGRLWPFDVLVVPAGSGVDAGPRRASARALVASIWPIAPRPSARDP